MIIMIINEHHVHVIVAHAQYSRAQAGKHCDVTSQETYWRSSVRESCQYNTNSKAFPQDDRFPTTPHDVLASECSCKFFTRFLHVHALFSYKACMQ